MRTADITILTTLALFWVLVFVWFHAGFLAVIALGAGADLTITLAGRRALRAKAVDIRRREGS